MYFDLQKDARESYFLTMKVIHDFWGADFKEKQEENMIDTHFLYFHEEIISAIELFVRNKNLSFSELF